MNRAVYFFLYTQLRIREEMIADFRSYGSDITYVDLVFPIGWLIHGIVYLTGLFLLIPLTQLKPDWINFGTVKILCMILERSCGEPEVA